MTDISHSMHMRGAIVAAGGIFIGALCQASLIDSSRCLPASPVFSTADDAATSPLPSWKTDPLNRACASPENRPQRPRAVEPKFQAMEIAGDGPQLLVK